MSRSLAMFSVAVGVCVFTFGIRPAVSETRNQQAAAEVNQALSLEANYGEPHRSRLLRALLDHVPNYGPARWQAGFLQSYSQWLLLDELADFANRDRNLTEYRRQRDRATDTVESQLALAQWCDKHKLADQRRAHLTRVLELNPDHPDARQMLGYRRVNGLWISEDEAKQIAQKAQKQQAVIAQWKPKLSLLCDQLNDAGQTRSAAAEEKLLAIRSTEAIPALEAVLGTGSSRAGLVLVKSLSQFAVPEASLALARLALQDERPEVSGAAQAALKTRDPRSYVPELLASMVATVQSRSELYTAPNGRIVFRFTTVRENSEFNDVAVYERTYPKKQLTAAAAKVLENSPTPGIREADIARQAAMRETAVAQRNAAVEARNARVSDVLALATGASAGNSAEQWQKWWSDYNEVLTVGSKPTRTNYTREDVVYSGTSTEGSIDPGNQSQYECLVAGTLVWTESGPVAIEKIVVGDRVAAKHPETGQLTLKPVLRTTVRPPESLVRIELDDGKSLQSSGGHPFWVSGKGWTKARKLEAGSVLHTATKVATVRDVKPAPAATTYNLVVADYHTYFVGLDKILSHDNTIPARTRGPIPGLEAK